MSDASKQSPAAMSGTLTAMPAAQAHGRERDVALDGLRFLAVVLMIASHTTRLIYWDFRRGWSTFSLLIEPLTASLFLILVGASLVHSRRAFAGGNLGWLRKQGVRALALWAVSCVFYALEEGFHFPDTYFLSGILATIAYTITLGSLLIISPRPRLALLLAAAASALWHVHLDRHGTQIFFINAGNSPMLPLFPLACLGALGVYALESPRRWVRLSLVAAALLCLDALLHKYTFVEIFSNPIGRYDAIRTIVTGSGDTHLEKSISYYNLRPILMPMIASLIVLVYAALALLRPLLKNSSRWLFPMGRHSLDVYILHLFILALLVLHGGKRPLVSSNQGDFTYIGIFIVCYAWSVGREKIKRRGKLRATSVSGV